MCAPEGFHQGGEIDPSNILPATKYFTIPPWQMRDHFPPAPVIDEVWLVVVISNQPHKEASLKLISLSAACCHGDAIVSRLASTPGPLTFVFSWRAWFVTTAWGRIEVEPGVGSPQSHHDNV